MSDMSDHTNLFLTRRIGEKVKIGNGITITVVDIRPGGQVRLGVETEPFLPVMRSELLEGKRHD